MNLDATQCVPLYLDVSVLATIIHGLFMIFRGNLSAANTPKNLSLVFLFRLNTRYISKEFMSIIY